jgi:hypothetical protein
LLAIGRSTRRFLIGDWLVGTFGTRKESSSDSCDEVYRSLRVDGESLVIFRGLDRVGRVELTGAGINMACSTGLRFRRRAIARFQNFKEKDICANTYEDGGVDVVNGLYFVTSCRGNDDFH